MIKLFSKLILTFILLMDLGFAGNEVGTGGDIVSCKKSIKNNFRGHYSLDYLVTYRQNNNNSDIKDIKNLQQSLKRIRILLEKNIPELIESYDRFLKYLPRIPLSRNYKPDFTKKTTWIPTSYKLIDVKDERLESQLAGNCLNNKKLQITQAIIKQRESISGRPPKNTIYYFDPIILEELNAKSPLQLSFLLIHEWLWDISVNVRRNRLINRFLHSKDWERMTVRNIRSQLLGMGLNIPKVSAKVFSENSCPHDPKLLWDFMKNKKRDPSGGSFRGVVWGNFKIYSRTRFCSNLSPFGCTDWSQKSKHQKFRKNKMIYFPLFKKDEFEIHTANPFENSIIHARCYMDYKTAKIKCGKMDYTFQNRNVAFIGRANNECIRLEFTTKDLIRTDIVERELIIYSLNKNIMTLINI